MGTTRSPIADRLREVLGEAAFRALVDEFGGSVIRVPKAVEKSELRGRVLAELACGRSYRETAERLGVDLSTVYRHASAT